MKTKKAKKPGYTRLRMEMGMLYTGVYKGKRYLLGVYSRRKLR